MYKNKPCSEKRAIMGGKQVEVLVRDTAFQTINGYSRFLRNIGNFYRAKRPKIPEVKRDARAFFETW
jgi:hypothetical protein